MSTGIDDRSTADVGLTHLAQKVPHGVLEGEPMREGGFTEVLEYEGIVRVVACFLAGCQQG